MAREIRSNAFDNQNSDLGGMDTERLAGFAGAEMADRGPKDVSGITGRNDEAETRPVTNMFAEPGGEEGDEDYDDEDDDMDLDDDDLGDEDGLVDDDDDVEIDETLDDEDMTDDDLLLDDDDEDDDDDDL